MPPRSSTPRPAWRRHQTDDRPGSDQVRLACPACSKQLVFPAALMADRERVRTKRFSCPSCQAHLRVSEAGTSLVLSQGTATQVVAPRQATQKIAPPTPATPTQKMAPQRNATVPIARPPAAPTLIQPAPSLTPLEGTPVAKANKRALLAIGAGSLLAVLAATALVAMVVVPSWRTPRTGRVHIDTSAVPAGAVYSLDGQAVDPSQLSKPLNLKAGAHELVVTRDGFQSFHRLFPVSAAEDSGFKILLTRDDPLPTVKDATPRVVEEKVVTPADEPSSPPPTSIVRMPAPPRPDPPRRPLPVAFRPVPDGPPVDKESLHTLLEKPNDFADRIVVPTGLYILGPITMGQPDGSATTTACRVALHAKTHNLAFLEPAETPIEVPIDPDLAAHLRSLADPRVPQSRTLLTGRWGQTAAVLTFHVQKRNQGEIDSDADPAVPILKKIEFLVGMNFYRVGEGNYKDSFSTLTATTSSAPVHGLSTRHDWSTRLSARYTNQLKHVVNMIKENKFYHNMQVLDNSLAQGFEAMIRSSVAPPALPRPQPIRIR